MIRNPAYLQSFRLPWSHSIENDANIIVFRTSELATIKNVRNHHFLHGQFLQSKISKPFRRYQPFSMSTSFAFIHIVLYGSVRFCSSSAATAFSHYFLFVIDSISEHCFCHAVMVFIFFILAVCIWLHSIPFIVVLQFVGVVRSHSLHSPVCNRFHFFFFREPKNCVISLVPFVYFKSSHFYGILFFFLSLFYMNFYFPYIPLGLCVQLEFSTNKIFAFPACKYIDRPIHAAHLDYYH